jgi:thiol:disulfide interchange protein DsbD
VVLALGLACLASPGAHAQKPPVVVSARLLLASQGAHPQSLVKAAVVAHVKAGYHINAHHPSLNYLIPTEVQFDRSSAASVERVIYPAGRLVRFAFSDTPLAVYEGDVLIGLVLRLGRPDASTEIQLRGKLSYQACNNHACMAPTSVPVTLAVPILPSGVALKPLHTTVFSKIRFH